MGTEDRFPVGQMPVTLAGHSFGFYYFDTPGERVGSAQIINGEVYPIRFGDAFQLTAANTVVDVGANVGAAAVFFATCFPKARVLAFEPSPQSFVLLRPNATHLKNLEVFNFGLFNDDRNVPLFTSRTDPATNSIGRSMLNSATTCQIQLKDALSCLQGLGVRSIDLLKVDTEGCEVPILSSLASWIPSMSAIYLEYHSEADRLLLDKMLAPTHLLCHWHSDGAHRGEVCYVAKHCIPDHERWAVSV